MRFSRFDGSPIVFFPTAWIVGNTQQPNSSLRSHRGGAFPPCWRQSNLLSKSSGLKCTEHITECFDGCHFALFCFTKSTHFFLLLLASGRSSSKKGITCSDIPLTLSFWLLQPAATQIVGIFFPHNRSTVSEDRLTEGNVLTSLWSRENRFLNWRH